LSRIYASKSRRKLQTFGWCLQFKQLDPWDLNVLLLRAKTSRGTFEICINLLRKLVSENFSIIYPFEYGENPCNFGSADIAAKNHNLSQIQRRIERGWEKESLCPPAHNADVIHGGGGAGVRRKGEGADAAPSHSVYMSQVICKQYDNMRYTQSLLNFEERKNYLLAL
jgi:hypothetical protein